MMFTVNADHCKLIIQLQIGLEISLFFKFEYYIVLP